jgi:hypothetical protein
MIFHLRNLHGEVMFLLFSLALLFHAGLSQASGAETIGNPTHRAEKTSEYDPVYDDFARFIAGIASAQSPLAAYEKKPAWTEYAAFFDKSWEKLEEKQLTLMREWASKELGAAASSGNTVLYPFSGPDFTNVHTLFPQARTYVLIALQPLGQIPDFGAMNDVQFNTFFADIKSSLTDLLNVHYFISAHMKAELQETEIKGVLPDLLVMIAREKARILDVRHWSMKPDGTIQEFSALREVTLDSNAVQGLRITFESPGPQRNQLQTLYYFRFNVYNFAAEQSRHFVSFLKGFSPFTTFMKSASFVMFDPHVSAARQFVLEQSHYILQEDSGIPVNYFDPALWDLEFFGVYTDPIPIFRQDYQEELAKIYRSGKNIKPLPFGIGYHFEAGKANLMFAEKKFVQ